MHTCRHTQQYLDVGVGFQWSEFHTFLFLFSPCNLFSLYTQTLLCICLMTTIPLLSPVCFLFLSTRRISWSVQCSKFISGANISNFFRSILHFNLQCVRAEFWFWNVPLFSPSVSSRWLCRCGCSGRTETGRSSGTEGLQTDVHSADTVSSEQRTTDPRTEPPSPCTHKHRQVDMKGNHWITHNVVFVFVKTSKGSFCKFS